MSDSPTERKEIIKPDTERIVLSEPAFSEFYAAISDEPEPPSEQLLNAVAVYKQHRPIKSKSRI